MTIQIQRNFVEKLENWSLTQEVGKELKSWTDSPRVGERVLGHFSARIMGCLLTPLAALVDSVFHLAFFGGRFLVGMCVLPLTACREKGVIKDLRVTASFHHLGQSLQFLWVAAISPLTALLSPSLTVAFSKNRAVQRFEERRREEASVQEGMRFESQESPEEEPEGHNTGERPLPLTPDERCVFERGVAERAELQREREAFAEQRAQFEQERQDFERLREEVPHRAVSAANGPIDERGGVPPPPPPPASLSGAMDRENRLQREPSVQDTQNARARGIQREGTLRDRIRAQKSNLDRVGQRGENDSKPASESELEEIVRKAMKARRGGIAGSEDSLESSGDWPDESSGD